MKTAKEIEAMMDVIMEQYQRAGRVEPTTALGHIWQVEILDRCDAAIDVLSWVLDQGGVDYRLDGGADPAIPLDGGLPNSEGYDNLLKLIRSQP